jgi:hypothetical protein
MRKYEYLLSTAQVRACLNCRETCSFLHESFSAYGNLKSVDADRRDRGHGKMRPVLIKTALVAALMVSLSAVSLPQTTWAGNPPIVTAQQWERAQRKQLLIRERFDKLLQKARAQQRIIMAWQKKAQLRQAKHKSQVASQAPKRNIAMAASR